jgi:hypothetical protein
LSGRTIRAGQPIKLRAQFKDDLNETAQASPVYIHVYEPDEVLDISNAILVSGIPTYLGEGIFEYEYTVPSTGPGGIWTDVWYGTLTGQTLSGIFNFTVSADGAITEIDQQLHNNNLVTLTLTSGILATDGTGLSEEYTAEFMTTTNPSYTNLRKIRLEVGSFVVNLEDDVIQTSILEASIEANILSFTTTATNSDLFEHARREYTTCMASSILLNNLNNTSLRAKTLGDLHVEYDTNGIRDSLTRLQNCIDKWHPQLLAGGGVTAKRRPALVVKGILDPDRPDVSRSWQSTEDGSVSRRLPAANTRERASGERRSLRTYRNRLSKKWW